jgi:nitrate reductase gamma subunit
MSYERFAELLKDEVQLAALGFMALMYVIKVRHLMRLKPTVDRTPNRGDPNAGMRYSLGLVAMPWEMQSYRRHPVRYVEFALFHLGVASAILATFLIPYLPRVIMTPLVKIPCMTLTGLGAACGLARLVRRLQSPAMRAVSTVDDYFSIVLLTAYLFSAFLAIPYAAATHWTTVVFFLMTTFFLLYVPFSKISHYILWPFARYYIGKHFGKRGVYPKRPGTIHPIQPA